MTMNYIFSPINFKDNRPIENGEADLSEPHGHTASILWWGYEIKKEHRVEDGCSDQEELHQSPASSLDREI